MLEINHLSGDKANAQTRIQLKTLGHHCSKAPNSQGWEKKEGRRQKWALERTFWNKYSLKLDFWMWRKQEVLEPRPWSGLGVQGHIYGTDEQKTHEQVSKKLWCDLSWKAQCRE